MHDHNGKGNSGMMWMMVICCVMPLVALFFVGGKISTGGYFWPVLIGIFVIVHIWMMFRGHGGKKDKS